MNTRKHGRKMSECRRLLHLLRLSWRSLIQFPSGKVTSWFRELKGTVLLLFSMRITKLAHIRQIRPRELEVACETRANIGNIYKSKELPEEVATFLLSGCLK